MIEVPPSPALAPLAAVARALGPLREEVVFIGGAIAPLLQVVPPFPRVRPTKDVDGIVASAKYGDVQRLAERLRQQGFREDTEGSHAHRWIAPDGTPFDLVPAGDHPGGSGNPWDQEVIETALTSDLGSSLMVIHASGPGFLALKWAAFRDRGHTDPLASEDLEDILALVASRPQLAEEVATAPDGMRAFIQHWITWFLANPYRQDLLAAHLNNATDVPATMGLVLQRLELMRASGHGYGT